MRRESGGGGMKHTPGPWTCKEAPHPQTDGVTGYTVQADTENGVAIVAEIYPRPYLVVVREANARLIAAAPELLDALERMCDLFAEGVPPAMGPGSQGLDTLRKSCAALAKARGEEPSHV